MSFNPSIHHQVIDYRGFRINYSVYGQGDPVICLHGLNMDGRMFAGRNLKELLADKMIVALDLPGYGRSDFIPGTAVEDISSVITRTADELGLSRFELCGFCLGGIFALDYAIRHQDRISKLYLIETMIYLPWWMKVSNTPLFNVIYKWLNQNRLCLSLLSLLPPLQGLAKMRNLKLMPQVWNNPVNSYYIRMMKEYQKIDHLQRSRDIACATKLIFSASSFKNIQRTNQELHRAIKKSTLHPVQTAGHFSLISSLPELL